MEREDRFSVDGPPNFGGDLGVWVFGKFVDHFFWLHLATVSVLGRGFSMTKKSAV
jgi:hypothetical protein